MATNLRIGSVITLRWSFNLGVDINTIGATVLDIQAGYLEVQEAAPSTTTHVVPWNRVNQLVVTTH